MSIMRSYGLFWLGLGEKESMFVTGGVEFERHLHLPGKESNEKHVTSIYNFGL